MSVSLSELDNRVFSGLQAAAEYLMLTDVHDATVQELNIRTMESRTSDINVLLATSDEFTPDVTPYDVTSLIGKSVPAWLEMQTVLISGVTWWYPVRCVNLNQLNDYQRAGAMAVAFYGDEPNSDTAQPTQYASFTFLPRRPCRIRFDRDNQRTAMASDIILPDNLSELIVLGAQNRLIPKIQFQIMMREGRDEKNRPFAQGLIQTLEGIRQQNMVVDMPPLIAQWMVWAYRDRSAQTSFSKPTPSSQANYPGGRNLSWGPYNGGYGGY